MFGVRQLPVTEIDDRSLSGAAPDCAPHGALRNRGAAGAPPCPSDLRETVAGALFSLWRGGKFNHHGAA